jgi:hypothetical protein
LGVLQGLLVLALLWWTWSAYAWLGNQARADTGVVRATMAVAMAALFVVSLTIPEAWNDAEGGLDGSDDGRRHHHHSGAPTVGIINNRPMPVGCPHADIMYADPHEPSLLRSLDDALTQKPVEHGRKDREYVELHATLRFWFSRVSDYREVYPNATRRHQASQQ